jgi:MFS family permease
MMPGTSNQEFGAQIRQARGKFAAMAAAYCLGVFNDNFFKQAVCLVAVYTARVEMKSWATLVFTLPWLLFAAPAGWMADRFPKRNVVIFAKALELVAMLCGGVGIILVNWPMILLMMFLMALQSTIFSPAMNGSIPELYPASYVIKANSFLKMLVNVGNLVGIILAGVALNADQELWSVTTVGRVIVGAGVVSISLVGLIVSLGSYSGPAASPEARFPWTGPLQTVRRLYETRRDPLLAKIIIADAYVWFVAVLQILIITEMGRIMWDLNERQTSYLLVTELLGVGAGGLLAGRLAKGQRWYRILPWSMVLLGAFTLLVSLTETIPQGVQIPWVSACLLLAGVAGGLLLIPMEAFFQIRPDAREKGAVISATNFAGFTGMAFSALADFGLRALWAGQPTRRFIVIGVVSLVIAFWLRGALRREEVSAE